MPASQGRNLVLTVLCVPTYNARMLKRVNLFQSALKGDLHFWKPLPCGGIDFGQPPPRLLSGTWISSTNARFAIATTAHLCTCRVCRVRSTEIPGNTTHRPGNRVQRPRNTERCPGKTASIEKHSAVSRAPLHLPLRGETHFLTLPLSRSLSHAQSHSHYYSLYVSLSERRSTTCARCAISA